MSFTSTSNEIFRHAIVDYHINDNVDTPIKNPFPENTINNILYHKCWIDTVQWHFEDIIRDPNIDPVAALVLKRRIEMLRYRMELPLIQSHLHGLLTVFLSLLLKYIT